MKKVLSFIIPAYNEENTILQVLRNIQMADLNNVDKEPVIINDNSTDNIRMLVEDYIENNKALKIKLLIKAKTWARVLPCTKELNWQQEILS